MWKIPRNISGFMPVGLVPLGKINWEDSWQQHLCDAGMYRGVTAIQGLFQDKPGQVIKEHDHAKRYSKLVSDCSCRGNRVRRRTAGQFSHRVVIDELGNMV